VSDRRIKPVVMAGPAHGLSQFGPAAPPPSLKGTGNPVPTLVMALAATPEIDDETLVVVPPQSVGQVMPFSPQNCSQKELPHTQSARQSDWQLKTVSPQAGLQTPSPQAQLPLQSNGQVIWFSPQVVWQTPSPQAQTPQSFGHEKGLSPQLASQRKFPQAHCCAQSCWQLMTFSPQFGSQKKSPHWQTVPQSVGQLN
jgi:hypothetical protein